MIREDTIFVKETTLLIVEDEAIIAADLSTKLEKLGYVIIGSTSLGEEALEIAQRCIPHLVLMDIRLAGNLDGIATAEIICKKLGLPVLFLTSHVDKETMHRAELSGSSGFIIKPIDERILHTQIQMALSKHGVERELRQVNDRFITTLESLTDGFVAWDRAWRYTYVNAAAEKLLHRNRDELIGKDVRGLYPGAAMQKVFARMENQRIAECIEDYSPRTGLWLEIRVYPTTDGWAIYFRDITERKKLDDALQKQNEQLIALSTRLQSIQEEEKRRLSRIIHDELGQILSAFKMDLSWLEKQLGKQPDRGDPSPVMKKIGEMKGTAEQTIQTIRRIAQELHPSIVDDLGFFVALEWQLKMFRERTGLTTSFENSSVLSVLPPTASIELFRIFQECLLNISRHAHATHVAVRLGDESSNLRLEVQDNGRGMPSISERSEKSLGIISMRERAHSIGGEIEISSGSGSGTSVVIKVPHERLRTP